MILSIRTAVAARAARQKQVMVQRTNVADGLNAWV